MLFNSWTFVLFALIVFPLYHVLPHRWQNRMLLVASYVFYGAWDVRFLALLFASTVIDYFAGLWIHDTENPRRRKIFLCVSMTGNLGVLGFFKYYNFFTESAVQGLQSLINLLGLQSSGFDPNFATLNIVLPVGISFYTFQTMSYAIDIYRRKLTPTRSFSDFALFVAYFPQLVAGPIERASHLLPQIMGRRTPSRDEFVSGAWLMLWGYFKKIVVADNLAVIVDQVFNEGAPPGGMLCLLGAYAFAFQIYCDFSGYSDIARGLSKWMGIDIMRNFNLPYFATNPQEFWHRWHISLSTWLRDYLYIPLGGSRHGTLMTYRNLFLTMLLGGLWHGAAWTFVAWGVFHGLLLAIHRLLFVDMQLLKLSGLPSRIAGGFLMFHAAVFGFMIFRCATFEQAFTMVKRIVTNLVPDIAAAEALAFLVLFAGSLVGLEAWLRNCDDPRTRPGWNRGLGALTVGLIIAALILLPPPAGKAFIYFQF